MTTRLERLTTAIAERYAMDGEVGKRRMAIVFLLTNLRRARGVTVKFATYT